MAKLLICDDEEVLRQSLSRYAHLEGHQVLEAANGQEAIALCKKEKPDLLILDIMMPVLDGFSALKAIRDFSDLPVIMLSAKGEEYDRIIAFELGVDDYVVKPFSSKEVMLRVEAILRRAKKDQDKASFALGDLLVDFDRKEVTIGGQPVAMAPMEYDLLFYFINHLNKARSREEIMRDLWGYEEEGDDRTLDTHIKLLRKALGPYADHLVTLRSYGYRFDEE